MGPLSVAGKTLGEVKTLLRNKFGTVAEVQSDVSIGQMKGFLVSVLGEVQSPGRYPGFLLPHRPPGDRHGGGDQGHRLAAARAGQAGEGNGQGDRRLRLPPAGGRHPRHPPALGGRRLRPRGGAPRRRGGGGPPAGDLRTEGGKNDPGGPGNRRGARPLRLQAPRAGGAAGGEPQSRGDRPEPGGGRAPPFPPSGSRTATSCASSPSSRRRRTWSRFRGTSGGRGSTNGSRG